MEGGGGVTGIALFEFPTARSMANGVSLGPTNTPGLIHLVVSRTLVAARRFTFNVSMPEVTQFPNTPFNSGESLWAAVRECLASPFPMRFVLRMLWVDLGGALKANHSVGASLGIGAINTLLGIPLPAPTSLAGIVIDPSEKVGLHNTTGFFVTEGGQNNTLTVITTVNCNTCGANCHNCPHSTPLALLSLLLLLSRIGRIGRIGRRSRRCCWCRRRCPRRYLWSCRIWRS